jgi:hypothetical protein
MVISPQASLDDTGFGDAGSLLKALRHDARERVIERRRRAALNGDDWFR